MFSRIKTAERKYNNNSIINSWAKKNYYRTLYFLLSQFNVNIFGLQLLRRIKTYF